jgi:hypothetical protein
VVPTTRTVLGVTVPHRRAVALLLASCLLAAGLPAGCAVATSRTEVMPEVYVADPEIAPAATDAFGAGRVRDAWDEITRFTLRTAFQEELVDPTKTSYTPVELTKEVTGAMTPDAAAGWSGLVGDALRGDAQARDEVQVLELFAIDAPASRVPKDGTVVGPQAVIDGRIGLVPAMADVPARLRVQLVHRATLSYEEDDTPYDLDARRTMTFHLEPAPLGSPSWLIAQYDGEMQLNLEKQ